VALYLEMIFELTARIFQSRFEMRNWKALDCLHIHANVAFCAVENRI
jgi:hypothetical protein